MKTLYSLLGLLVLSVMPVQAQTTFDLFVTSRDDNSIKQFDGPTGAYKGVFIDATTSGLSAPQEVLLHPDGYWIVTGRWNQNLQKYDLYTGQFLGNWSSGYTLDQPTKTTLGPNGLLYVSQWSATQNKVVRFDWQTGAFVDEFTNIGVPNGMGQAWDSTGNLYVTRWGTNGNDGEVLRFDTAGVFDTIFIPTGDVQGPVNIWIDSIGQVNVVDWTLGAVRQFDATGQYLSAIVTGLTRAEGFTFGPDGLFYLCDWQANRVFRYDLVNGGGGTVVSPGILQTPNGISTGPSFTEGQREFGVSPLEVEVFPQPGIDQFTIRLQENPFLKSRVKISDLQGRVILEDDIIGQHSWSVLDWSAGIYLYSIQNEEGQASGRLIISNQK